jgi:hypothetical protein
MQMNFTLNLAVDEEDLRIFKPSGLRITVAKPVGDGDPNVAWLVFDPFASNTVVWSEKYGLYASTVAIQQGAVVSRMSDLSPEETIDGKSYLFGNEQVPVFDPGNEHCDKGSFKIKNLMGGPDYPKLTFGLTQDAEVNGKKVKASFINAAPVPSMHNVTFTPLTKVYVWLQSIYRSGTVITDIMSAVTEVTFGQDHTENSLIYDRDQGHFVPASSGVAENILIRKPALIY